MTQNQIAFQRAKIERDRADIAKRELDEAIRHNMRAEAIDVARNQGQYGEWANPDRTQSDFQQVLEGLRTGTKWAAEILSPIGGILKAFK